jgi:hypothetical protein
MGTRRRIGKMSLIAGFSHSRIGWIRKVRRRGKSCTILHNTLFKPRTSRNSLRMERCGPREKASISTIRGGNDVGRQIA